ncbi:MAG: energy transducer TonB [Bacteroidota bacterium]
MKNHKAIQDASVRKDQIDAYLKEIEYSQRAALKKKISYIFIGFGIAGGIAIAILTQIHFSGSKHPTQVSLGNTLETTEVVNSSLTVPEQENPSSQQAGNSVDSTAFFSPEEQPSDNTVIISDRMPSFPGGEPALYRFISREVRYPQTARRRSVEGKVHLRFVVEADGKISNVKVVRGLGYGCDEEALRILNKMPIWEPGVLNGKAVPVYSSLAVEFRMI